MHVLCVSENHLQLIAGELDEVVCKAVNVQCTQWNMAGQQLEYDHATYLTRFMPCFNLADRRRVLNEMLQS